MEGDATAAPEQKIERLYTPREVSEATGLHLETIKRLTRAGDLAFVDVSETGNRRNYRYTAAQINAFIEQRTKSRR